MESYSLTDEKFQSKAVFETLHQGEPFVSNEELLPLPTEKFDYSLNSFFEIPYEEDPYLGLTMDSIPNESQCISSFDFDFQSFDDNFPSIYEDISMNVAPLTTVVDDYVTNEGQTFTMNEINRSSKDVDKNNRLSIKEKSKSIAIDFDDIARHFDVPITKAAKKLNVGLTALKKRCRELNIERWPHRKIQSLKSLIDNLEELGLSREAEILEENKRLMERMPELELTEKTKKLRQACFKANYKKRRSVASIS